MQQTLAVRYSYYLETVGYWKVTNNETVLIHSLTFVELSKKSQDLRKIYLTGNLSFISSLQLLFGTYFCCYIFVRLRWTCKQYRLDVFMLYVRQFCAGLKQIEIRLHSLINYLRNNVSWKCLYHFPKFTFKQMDTVDLFSANIR
jgi:hypothetical protein